MISIPDDCHVVVVTMADMDYIIASIFVANSYTDCEGKDENYSCRDSNHTSSRFALRMVVIVIIVVVTVMIIVVTVAVIAVAMVPGAIADVNCE